ncbi:MAG: hypothetical protein LBJ14_01895 [Desulfarculales bacterium]|jgi:hypothetical protein|nr:hypothetical protein [Desulfarculales bacterium]
MLNKEKKQSRRQRRLIGRVDEDSGAVLPTDGRCRKNKSTHPNTEALKISRQRSSKTVEIAVRKYYGATYLLDAISKKLKLTRVLRRYIILEATLSKLFFQIIFVKFIK